MKILKLLSIAMIFAGIISCTGAVNQPVASFGLVIHGGAGTITKENTSPEKEKLYSEKLKEVLQTGYKILNKGGSALDAVEKCINMMEDSPLFNSGKGAVFAANGKNELDASIMEGKTLNAGAVAGVTHIKNPISLARLVMEKSPHVLLAREGAEAFAQEQGIELVDEKYFFTESRWDRLQKAKQRETDRKSQSSLDIHPDEKYGTVGAAALDKNGNLAAGTSTGGMTNKHWGRIGDSPIIGAGTYANNKTCAISATGHGEYFIRGVITHDISAMMEYAGKTLQQAAREVIQRKLKAMGGSGGIIAIDHLGNVVMEFNTAGMFRGVVTDNSQPVVLMFGEEQK